MAEQPPLTCLGLMSGTSLDGVDAAVVRTDGQRVEDRGPALTVPYDEDLRLRLRGLLGSEGNTAVSREMTLIHAQVVHRLLAENGMVAADIDLMGFHGHTVLHRPDRGLTRQIGDGALLARQTGIPVIADFRGRDVAAGGEGAPLAPLYHAALARGLEKPLAVLNLGGVANLTWIGHGDRIMAFDTGPGNALIDDWTRRTTGAAFDEKGRLAARGRADAAKLAALLDHPYFGRQPPKSLDRGDFHGGPVEGMSPADGAATLTLFTAAAVARARDFLPQAPARWLVCGGGRHNRALMAALADALAVPVEPVETVGWRGDFLEAEAFAFLAARSLRGLPLSLPETTGVARPTTGGTLYRGT